MTAPFPELEDELAADPGAFLRAALRWHFDDATGSPLWLDLRAELGFDPLTDVRGFEDLRLFPDVAADLRDRPVADLVPRGLAGEAPAIFETGGTTGAPKRLPYTRRWIERALRWKVAELTDAGFPAGRPWLVAMPSGPHAFGHTTRLQAAELGSLLHTVDLDPRWVKKLIAARQDPSPYVEHVGDQVAHALRTQEIAALTTTPALLGELLVRDDLVTLLRERLRYLALAGARLDPDTRDLVAETLPDVSIQNLYGSTMVLTTAKPRPRLAADDPDVYDGYGPFVTFAVVDPDTADAVPLGERGQVRMSHVSSGVFIPNNLERDSAVRRPGVEGGVGDAIEDPAPLAAFEGETVIEGVY